MSEDEIEKSSNKEGTANKNVEATKGKNRSLWVIVLISVLCLSLVCVGIFLYNWLQKEEPVAEDESWSRVQEAGVLKVATSADYPPFTYYNQDQGIDGFDPALMREIGDKLGVRVEIADYAFEGLGGVLDVGQADVSIAAISITPARIARFDFSNIYYVGEDGILAQADSEIGTITNPVQMVDLRIGVQKFSVYETWAQDVLIDGNTISDDQLLSYAKAEHALNDLRQGRVDLVIMDLQPATLALHDGVLKLVGQGLDQQRLAIALPKGAEALRGKINEALLTLQNEGQINQLLQTYLGLKPEDVIPPPTPEPTEAPCVDAMEFVEDLSYDDEDLSNYPKVDPGESFQKGWRIKNSGTCIWNGTYFIKYVHGSDPAAQMGGQPTAIKGAVEPGDSYEMYVDLVAPQVAGKYVGYWQMHNPDNEAFGQTIWVAIQVRKTEPEAPTATVTPETTPTPTEEPTLTPTATEVPPEPTATEVPPEPTATEVPPTPTATEEPGADLRDITWILEGYLADIEDEELTEPIEDIDVKLIFGEDGLVEGHAGCNTFSGRYVTDGVEILFKDILATNVLCNEPAGIMEQEAHFLFLLDRVEEYRFNEDEQLELIREIIEDDELVDKVLLLFYDLSIEQQ